MALQSGDQLELFDHPPQIFFGFPEFLLESAQQFVILPLTKRQVVIGQISILLLKLTFDLVPGTFHLKFVHTLFLRFSAHSRPLPDLDFREFPLCFAYFSSAPQVFFPIGPRRLRVSGSAVQGD